MLSRLLRKAGLSRDLRARDVTLSAKYPEWEIGEHSYGWPTIHRFDATTRLRIGKYCSLAHGVLILVGGEHRADWMTTYPFPELWPEASEFVGHPASKGSLTIGNDVWIGAQSLILSGVTIGDGAVIGAGSVVTRDIPAFAVGAGNPCKPLRSRFPDDVVEALLLVRWWDWSHEEVVRALPLLLSEDYRRFLAYAAERSQ